jgi:hypothetical protein
MSKSVSNMIRAVPVTDGLAAIDESEPVAVMLSDGLDDAPQSANPICAEAYAALVIELAEGGNPQIDDDDFAAICAGAGRTVDDFSRDVSEWQSMRFKASMSELKFNARIAAIRDAQDAAYRFLNS